MLGAAAAVSSAVTALLLCSARLDLANRCTRLGSKPARLEDELTLAAPIGVALRTPCRELVSELGGRVIGIQMVSPAWAAGVLRLVLLARYGASVTNAAEASEAADAAYCDVIFTRGQLRRRVATRVSQVLRVAGRRPVFRRVQDRLSLLARAQLTPANPPPLLLRLLPRLPWRCQRQAARLWVQAQLPQLPAGDVTKNPMLAVQTVPLLDEAECAAAVREAEAWGALHGWTTDRHVAFPTTDIPLRHLPQLQRLWNESLFPRVERAQRAALGLGAAEQITPLDVFVVKYSAAGQKELAVHRDNGLLTFSLLLNPPQDFSDGGTYFERSGRVYRPSVGVGVLHSALARHAGYPIGSGERYVLVGFCGLRSPRLPAGYGEWRFGEPGWYVSSAVVGDEQVLQRVWPARGTVASPRRPAPLPRSDSDAAHPADDVRAIRDVAGTTSPAREEEAEEEAAAALAVEVEATEGARDAMGGAQGGEGQAEAGSRSGEKPWYARQHEAAAEAARAGALLERHRARNGLRLEYWRAEDGDVVGLLLRVGEGGESVVGSLVYREGGLAPSLRGTIRAVLPPRIPWLARARAVLALAPRWRVSGLVHVYVAPDMRGHASGAALMRGARRVLRRLGISHELTLADDSGSGKLRAWYESLGFVDASGFMETAMVART